MLKYFSFIITIALLLCGCSSEGSIINDSEDIFYVKYEVKMYFPSGGEQTISYTTENGQKSTTTTSKTWNGIYGPFKNGDAVKLSSTPSLGSSVRSTNYVRIYVSNNNSVFSIKSENTSDFNGYLNATYSFR